MLLQAARDDPVMKVRKEASLNLIRLLYSQQKDLIGELKELIKPEAREFTRIVLNWTQADSAPIFSISLLNMIEIFPEDLDLQNDIIDHFVQMFSSRFKQQNTCMTKDEILIKDERILRNLKKVADYSRRIAQRMEEKSEIVCKLDTVIGDCLIQMINENKEDISKLYHDIIKVLLNITNRSMSVDVFRLYEPVCDLLGRRVADKCNSSPMLPVLSVEEKSLLENYISSEVFAQSRERNAKLMLGLYRRFTNFDSSDYAIFKWLLVKLDQSENTTITEDILKFVIEKWQTSVLRPFISFDLEFLSFLYAGLCYHLGSMKKIFKNYEKGKISRQQQEAAGMLSTHRDAAYLVILACILKECRKIARPIGGYDIETAAIEIVLGAMGAHNGIENFLLLPFICKVLSPLTSDIVTIDAFRAFEPLCRFLKSRQASRQAYGMLGEERAVLENYIKSHVFAQSIERNASLVFELYMEPEKFSRYNFNIIRMLLVRLRESAKSKSLAEKILKFVITKWPADEEALKDVLVKNDQEDREFRTDCKMCILVGFCYYRGLMFKILDNLQLTETGEFKQKVLYNRLFRCFLYDWTETSDIARVTEWPNRRLNILAICELLELPVNKRQAIIKNGYLYRLVRSILSFYQDALNGQYGVQDLKPIVEWKSERGDWWQIDRMSNETLDTEDIHSTDLLLRFGGIMSKLEASNSSADADCFKVIMAPLSQGEKKIVGQFIESLK